MRLLEEVAQLQALLPAPRHTHYAHVGTQVNVERLELKVEVGRAPDTLLLNQQPLAALGRILAGYFGQGEAGEAGEGALASPMVLSLRSDF